MQSDGNSWRNYTFPEGKPSELMTFINSENVHFALEKVIVCSELVLTSGS